MQSKELPLNERIKRMENLGLIDPIDDKGLVKVPPPIPVQDGIAQKLLQEDR
jgi:hypothetical protein